MGVSPEKGDVATAAAECEAIKQKHHAADAYELAVAAARLQIAQVEYQAALIALTPTPTRTATPTPSPTPTRTPTPTPEAEIFALVGGIVVGNEATVEITILPGRVELTSGPLSNLPALHLPAPCPPPSSASPSATPWWSACKTAARKPSA